MMTLVHALALATLLAPTGSAGAGMVPAAPDTSVLQFHGFRAGSRLDDIEALTRGSGGGHLRCRRAKTDHRVTECRASVQLTDLGEVDVWVSAVDSVASVLTLSGAGAGGQVDRWRHSIERRYGHVGAKVEGPQWMMQWVRQGRMLRLTWRTDRDNRPVSVSLIDGHVLDAWGRDRARRTRTAS